MLKPSTECTFRIPHSEVHVWCFDTRLGSENSLSHLKQVLSPTETEKAQRFIHLAHQQRAIYARGILRVLLSRYLNLNPAEIILTQNDYGKPMLDPMHGEFAFNLSHSGDWIVYAFAARGCLGIDIEECEEKEDFVALTKHFASDVEIQAIQQVDNSDRNARFYRLWTAKEAVIKAIGKGFYADTRKFSVECRMEEPLRVLQSDAEATRDWQLEAFTPDAGYAACVVSDFGGDVQYFSVDSLFK